MIVFDQSLFLGIYVVADDSVQYEIASTHNKIGGLFF